MQHAYDLPTTGSICTYVVHMWKKVGFQEEVAFFLPPSLTETGEAISRLAARGIKRNSGLEEEEEKIESYSQKH